MAVRLVVDHRDSLARRFDREELLGGGLEPPVAQANMAYTERASTLRGMHFPVGWRQTALSAPDTDPDPSGPTRVAHGPSSGWRSLGSRIGGVANHVVEVALARVDMGCASRRGTCRRSSTVSLRGLSRSWGNVSQAGKPTTAPRAGSSAARRRCRRPRGP